MLLPHKTLQGKHSANPGFEGGQGGPGGPGLSRGGPGGFQGSPWVQPPKCPTRHPGLADFCNY